MAKYITDHLGDIANNPPLDALFSNINRNVDDFTRAFGSAFIGMSFEGGNNQFASFISYYSYISVYGSNLLGSLKTVTKVVASGDYGIITMYGHQTLKAGERWSLKFEHTLYETTYNSLENIKNGPNNQVVRLNFWPSSLQNFGTGSLTLSGDIKYSPKFQELTGNISKLTYADSGNSFTISGININAKKLAIAGNLNDFLDKLMSGNDSMAGGNSSEILNGMKGNDSINGGAGQDTLLGGAGNDLINGGLGVDSLIGGGGDDIYIIDLDNPDVIQEEANGGNDTNLFLNNNLSSTTPIILNVADYSNIESITVSGKGLFNLNGDGNNNKLTGNASANNLAGGDGNDTLVGGGGIDTLDGGAGDDTYVIDSLDDQYSEDVDAGSDTIEIAYKNPGKKAVTLLVSDYQNFENLSVSGVGLYNLTGDSNNNVLKGNASANKLDGNGGEDAMDGGGGNDTYLVDSAGDVTGETLTGKLGGIDIVIASYTHTLGANIENLTLTGTANINGTGSSSNNLILGNTGDNIIDGGAGSDTLKGGDGNDTYYVDDEKDQIVDIDQGTTIYSTSLNYTLSKDFTSITLIGTGNINAKGNDKNNTLMGNAGNNILDGAKGIDTLAGGLGDDTYLVNLNEMDVIEEDSLGGSDTYQIVSSNLSKTSAINLNVDNFSNIENITVSGSGLFNLAGNDRDNKLVGNKSANLIEGYAGNDTLVSGGGLDTLIGGLGDDVYVINSQDVMFFESVDSGNDTLVINYNNLSKKPITINLNDYPNFENITINGKGLFNIIGNDGDNLLVASLSTMVIDGGEGNDTLNCGLGSIYEARGGVGNDTYIIKSQSKFTTYDLGGDDTILLDYDNQDMLPRSLSLIDIGEPYNHIENVIVIGDGAYYLYGDRKTLIVGGSGNDGILGSNVRKSGANGTLMGGDGDDTLDGFGGETLIGGNGRDVFHFVNSPESYFVIEDFVSGTDKLDIDTTIDQFKWLKNLTANDFISGPDAVNLHTSEYLIFDTTNNNLYLDSDGPIYNNPLIKIASIKADNLVFDDFTFDSSVFR